MKRYYSHYTFIYPDIYLKNHIVEMDSDGHIVNCFPFEKEIERTEFYSGLLIFIPKDRELSIIEDKLIWDKNMFVASVSADPLYLEFRIVENNLAKVL